MLVTEKINTVNYKSTSFPKNYFYYIRAHGTYFTADLVSFTRGVCCTMILVCFNNRVIFVCIAGVPDSCVAADCKKSIEHSYFE